MKEVYLIYVGEWLDDGNGVYEFDYVLGKQGYSRKEDAVASLEIAGFKPSESNKLKDWFEKFDKVTGEHIEAYIDCINVV